MNQGVNEEAFFCKTTTVKRAKKELSKDWFTFIHVFNVTNCFSTYSMCLFYSDLFSVPTQALPGRTSMAIFLFIFYLLPLVLFQQRPRRRRPRLSQQRPRRRPRLRRPRLSQQRPRRRRPRLSQQRPRQRVNEGFFDVVCVLTTNPLSGENCLRRAYL